MSPAAQPKPDATAEAGRTVGFIRLLLLLSLLLVASPVAGVISVYTGKVIASIKVIGLGCDHLNDALMRI